MESWENNIEFLIKEAFLGYKYRKERKKLFSNDGELPKKLLYLYYTTNQNINFENIPNSFINQYIKNECKLENVHDSDEIIGQGVMYDYAHTTEDKFDIYSLLDYHKRLYSLAPFPECAGVFRNFDVYLPGTGTEIAEWSMIRTRIRELDPVVNSLLEQAHLIKDTNNFEDILKYIDACIHLKCDLIKIHPFFDGNGRTIRCFINKMFELAGVPPIYIKERERTEYHKAMNKANCEGDFSEITNFYYYKICDSIVELDINKRLVDEQHQKVKKIMKEVLLNETEK